MEIKQFEDFHSGVGVGSQQPSSFERQREVINDISNDLFAKFKEAGVRVTETPSMPISGNSGNSNFHTSSLLSILYKQVLELMVYYVYV